MRRMNRLAVVLALGLATPVTAQTVQEALIAQLTQQGYSDIEVSRTFLGRVRIEAHGNGIEREIIFNPSSGEILRDFWERDEDEDDEDEDDETRLIDPNGEVDD